MIIQQEKMRFSAKNFKKDLKTKFFCHAWGPLKSFLFNFQKKLNKILQKWLFWDKSNSEKNKVNNFGDPSPTSVETKDKYMMHGSNWPIPAWKMVKFFAALIIMQVLFEGGSLSRIYSISNSLRLIPGRCYTLFIC